MQISRYLLSIKSISSVFLVVCLSCVFYSSNAIADDHRSKTNKHDRYELKELDHEKQDDDGNEMTGEAAAWLFAVANLTVLFGLLYRGINRYTTLTENAKNRFKSLKKIQKKYLMPFHYLLNIIALLLAIIHFSLSNCRSSSLPELGLALMVCFVVAGMMLKINVTPKGIRRFIHKIHTNPLTISLVVSVLLVGHIIVD